MGDMQKVDGFKLLNFASQIDYKTIDQAKETASMPFVHPHVALMPDAHLGKGSAVGTVIPTVDAVIPAAVGVDIGCGMIAARTRFTAADIADKNLADLRESLQPTARTACTSGRNRTCMPCCGHRVLRPARLPISATDA